MYFPVKVKIDKNKLAPTAGKSATYWIKIGGGVDTSKEICDIALEKGILVKKGAWWSYEGNNVAQGDLNMLAYLGENPTFLNELKTKLS